jgi:hypothetical protein
VAIVGPGTYIPDDEGVVVLATERGEVLLVVREREALDEHLVKLQPLHHLQSVEVPDDNVSLRKS